MAGVVHFGMHSIEDVHKWLWFGLWLCNLDVSAMLAFIS